jgi:diguanylate cyclase (GGDEF)-like protein
MLLRTKFSLVMTGLSILSAAVAGGAVLGLARRSLERQAHATLDRVLASFIAEYKDFVDENRLLAEEISIEDDLTLAVSGETAKLREAADFARKAASKTRLVASTILLDPRGEAVFATGPKEIYAKALASAKAGSAFLDAADLKESYRLIEAPLPQDAGRLIVVADMGGFMDAAASRLEVMEGLRLSVFDPASGKLVLTSGYAGIAGSDIKDFWAGKIPKPGFSSYRIYGEARVLAASDYDGRVFAVSLSKRALYAELDALTLIGLAAIAVIAAVALASAVLLSRGASRPLSALADVARSYGRLDFSPSLPSGGRDEIGSLSKAFGAMAGEIAGFTGSLEGKIRERTAQLEEKIREVELLSVTDPLTGISNRRKMDQALPMEIERARRSGDPLSVIMFDIDRFKSVNDRFGHEVGDEVLKSVSARAASLMRYTDEFCRWGGEEFLILLPDTDAQGAGVLAEKIRRSVESTKHPFGEPVTVSLGVTVFRPDDDAESLVRRADDCMYRAKGTGRNKVVLDEAAELPGDRAAS